MNRQTYTFQIKERSVRMLIEASRDYPFAEHNHSERSWLLLTQVMPYWKKVKTQLDSMAELYLNE